jgi:tRNA (guanine-N7-)-methyltransferase
LAALLPQLRLELPAPDPLEPRRLFGVPVRAVWLEIGFGGGEHLVDLALRHPDRGFIGVEPYLGGVVKLLAAIECHGLRNLRIVVDDARLLLAALPAASIERIFVLYPDPWPKTRHHKRRIVSRQTAPLLARALVPGGELRLATDSADYAGWMMAALGAERGLAWCAERAADWRERPIDQLETRYEAKARAAGRRPFYLRFLRDGAAA